MTGGGGGNNLEVMILHDYEHLKQVQKFALFFFYSKSFCSIPAHTCHVTMAGGS